MTMANAMPSVTSEWPDWMNPLLVRSLRQSLRSRAFEWILLWLCGSSTLLMVCGSLLPEGQMDEVTVFFWINAAVVLHLLLPGRMMVAVQDDRRPGNFDLIKMTRTDVDGLVMQHLKTLMCHAGLVVSILLPYVLLRLLILNLEIKINKK